MMLRSILGYLFLALAIFSQAYAADIYPPHAVITATNNNPSVGEVVTFTSAPFPNLFYYWSMDGDSGKTLGTNQYSRQILKTGPNTVYLVVTDAAGRQFFSESYRVIGVQQPQIFVSNQNPKVGEYVTFSAPVTQAGYSYFWLMDEDTQWTPGNQFVRQMVREGVNNIYLKAMTPTGREYFNQTFQIVVLRNTQPSQIGVVPIGSVCYQTNWGLLTLTFTHEDFYWISGTFAQNTGNSVDRMGDIKKAILSTEPPMVKTYWLDSSERHGEVEIYFKQNFNSFTGKYGFAKGNPPNQELHGQRVECTAGNGS